MRRLSAIVVTCFTLFVPWRTWAQGSDPLWKEVQREFATGNRLAIAEIIADPEGDATTISRYFDVERALYWEGHDLPAAIFVAQQGIAYCLARAAIADENPALAAQFRGAAGRIAFNLASSTWPGWDEAGIVITADERRLGEEGARLALRISEDLNAGPGALANGYWMVGAHQLASGEFDDAISSFQRAALFGGAAEDRGTELVSEGFVAITEVAANRDPERARQRLDGIRATLEREVEDPEFWTTQFDTAWRVFVAGPE